MRSEKMNFVSLIAYYIPEPYNTYYIHRAHKHLLRLA